MVRLSDFLEPFPDGTHIILENEDKETLLNDQKGGAYYKERMTILQHGCVLKALTFDSKVSRFPDVNCGLKLMVGHHET